MTPIPLSVFSTCPSGAGQDPAAHLAGVRDAARWSERQGCDGILVYTDNSLVDPWVVTQDVIQVTERLAPLVAVQPVYKHPYAVAKTITSLANLYGRRVHLNMVAGGFKNDLLALNDTTPHDHRYDRLWEYTAIVSSLLDGGSPVTFEGRFYTVRSLKLTPTLPSHLRPRVFVSGSSEAGRAAAEKLEATAIRYPEPTGRYVEASSHAKLQEGIRVGIIARGDSEEAWRVAFERFPGDRTGRITHALAMKTSDSQWHKRLSQIAEESGPSGSPYWMFPFQNYKTFCPYLVGSYEEVGSELARYVGNGVQTVLLDIPREEEDLIHARAALDLAAPTG